MMLTNEELLQNSFRIRSGFFELTFNNKKLSYTVPGLCTKN